MLAKIALVLVATFSFQRAQAQGLDLNPALLGCIMSGGSCLSKTGIPIVDLFFGGKDAPSPNDEDLCRGYITDWCSAPHGYPSAHYYCREAKKKFYKTAKQQMGDWHPPTGQKPRVCENWTEQDYFDQIETQFGYPKYYGEPKKPPYFTCTPKQQHIWLKNRCEHTHAYRKFWGHNALNKSRSDHEWSFFETQTCDGH